MFIFLFCVIFSLKRFWHQKSRIGKYAPWNNRCLPAFAHCGIRVLLHSLTEKLLTHIAALFFTAHFGHAQSAFAHPHVIFYDAPCECSPHCFEPHKQSVDTATWALQNRLFLPAHEGVIIQIKFNWCINLYMNIRTHVCEVFFQKVLSQK